MIFRWNIYQVPMWCHGIKMDVIQFLKHYMSSKMVRGENNYGGESRYDYITYLYSKKMKKAHVLKIAKLLISKKRSWTFEQLSRSLNLNGLRTERGTVFCIGGIGTAKLVSSVWHDLDKRKLFSDRDAVAHAFTNTYGNYSYE